MYAVMSAEMKSRTERILRELGGWKNMPGCCQPNFTRPGGWCDAPDAEPRCIRIEDIPDAAMMYVAVMLISMEVILGVTGMSEEDLRGRIAEGLFPAPITNANLAGSEYWNRSEVLAWFDTMILVASHIESDMAEGADAGVPDVESVAEIAHAVIEGKEQMCCTTALPLSLVQA